MPPTSRRRTVRQSSEQGDREQFSRGQLDDSVRAAVPYFRSIVPTHMNAEQYAAIVIGLLHKDHKLADTAMRNQPSFMAALADCARLGLVPGDRYALWPLNYGKANAAVLGDTTYTGEIELMYRSGGVASIIAEVVRRNDHYQPGRHPHDPPEFYRQPDDWASEGERGDRRGVFCYCVLDTGAVSRVVRMGAAEVMRHKDAARGSDSEYSPWNGDFEDSMWLKTGVHEEFKWVPHSAEYRRDLMSAAAALQGTPLGELTKVPTHEFGAREPAVTLVPPNRAAIGGGGSAGSGQPGASGGPGAERAVGSSNAPERRQGRADTPGDIPACFDVIGISADADRKAYVKAILGEAWNSRRGLTDDETGRVLQILQQAISAATAEDTARDVLDRLTTPATDDS